MHNKRTTKHTWLGIAFAVLCFGLGFTLLCVGAEARSRGRILPSSAKAGPMNGTHAMVAGVGFIVFGAAWVLTTVGLRKTKDAAHAIERN
jgi:hypothetical protein